MASRIALTELAQEAWKSFLPQGALAVDGTAGNGQDTLFLARHVGPEGHVYAIDIQEDALEMTAANLKTAGLLDRVTLLAGDHSKLSSLLGSDRANRMDLVCFNLGYLPGGNHEIRTSAESTAQALRESLALLKPTGALSVIAYRGHSGGLEEAQAVEEFSNSLPESWTCRQHCATGSENRPGPVWWLFTRETV